MTPAETCDMYAEHCERNAELLAQSRPPETSKQSQRMIAKILRSFARKLRESSANKP